MFPALKKNTAIDQSKNETIALQKMTSPKDLFVNFFLFLACVYVCKFVIYANFPSIGPGATLNFIQTVFATKFWRMDWLFWVLTVTILFFLTTFNYANKVIGRRIRTNKDEAERVYKALSEVYV